jgi:hypothetical protein
MAESLAHRWGQIIGDVFEVFVRNILAEVAQQNGLYFDFKAPQYQLMRRLPKLVNTRND